MASLEALAKHYAQLDTEEKALKKEKAPINKQIKNIMKEQGLKTFEAGDVKLTFDEQTRSTMNEDALVTKLKNLGLTDAIITVEKPDEEVVSQLIYEGKLPAEELQSCVTNKIVEVLKVTVKK